ncbi:MAG: histidine kinase [Planctomycetes bacterium RBG_13_63_9]|nr:MAG: histidine kinase [Planctomycetes bacterium RBG_13_63_9]
MSIITISRGSYSRGKEVAEKVAQKLGYQCISRDVIVEACDEYNVPEVKLIRAIHDAPSILERFTGGKNRFLAFFQAMLLDHFQEDNVVYHGLAGHLFVKDVSHVLKIRIIAEMEDRVRLEMQRERISRGEALRILRHDDEERRKWSQHLFGVDPWDPALYDLVLHIKKITADEAAELICHTVALEHFQTTPQSQQIINDLTISAKVRAALIDLKPEVEVSAENGVVCVDIKSSQVREEWRIQKLAKAIPGVKDVEIRSQEVRLAP